MAACSRDKVRVATVVLCIVTPLTSGCVDSLIPDPEIDYREFWVGDYNGSTDIIYAGSGAGPENLSTFVHIYGNNNDNVNKVEFAFDLPYLHPDVNVPVVLHATHTLKDCHQFGNTRTCVTVSRDSLGEITGTIIVEMQTTGGDYVLQRTYTTRVKPAEEKPGNSMPSDE